MDEFEEKMNVFYDARFLLERLGQLVTLDESRKLLSYMFTDSYLGTTKELILVEAHLNFDLDFIKRLSIRVNIPSELEYSSGLKEHSNSQISPNPNMFSAKPRWQQVYYWEGEPLFLARGGWQRRFAGELFELKASREQVFLALTANDYAVFDSSLFALG